MNRFTNHLIGVLLGAAMVLLFWGIYALNRPTPQLETPTTRLPETARQSPSPPAPVTDLAPPVENSSLSARGRVEEPTPHVAAAAPQSGDTQLSLMRQKFDIDLQHDGRSAFSLQPSVVISDRAGRRDLSAADREQLRQALAAAVAAWRPTDSGQGGRSDRGSNPSPDESRADIDVERTLAAMIEAMRKSPPQQGAVATTTPTRLKLPIVVRIAAGGPDPASLRDSTEFRTQLGTYTTTYRVEDTDRCVNLAIATRKINGLVLRPGEEFSFNRSVGPRTARHGFRKAGVISNGKVIPGLGGGICQVSTTLFNAALRADLAITERYHHSIYDGIPYAEKGLDAAVVYGAKDFRFRNRHPFPILITCEMADGVLTARIFGPRKPFEDVRLVTRNLKAHEPEEQRRINPKLAPGTLKEVSKGVTGYSVDTFRIVVMNGKAREEKLHSDRYLTFPRVVEVAGRP